MPGIDDNQYTVLVILTDGAINDIQQTIDAIVYATNLPISIIIIGIGNADFSTMEYLDGDKQRLKSSNGTFAARDIVQFVPFNEYVKRGPEELAAEVLRELPTQVTEFFAMVNKKPDKPLQVNIDQVFQAGKQVGKGLLGTVLDPTKPVQMKNFIAEPENPVEKLEEISMVEKGEEDPEERRKRLKELLLKNRKEEMETLDEENKE